MTPKYSIKKIVSSFTPLLFKLWLIQAYSFDQMTRGKKIILKILNLTLEARMLP